METDPVLKAPFNLSRHPDETACNSAIRCYNLGQKVTISKPPASVRRDAEALVGRAGRLVCLNHQDRAVWAMMDEPIPQEAVHYRHRQKHDSRRDWVLLRPAECEISIPLPEWV